MVSVQIQSLFQWVAVVLTLFVTGLALPSSFAQDLQTRFNGRIMSGDGNPIPNTVIVVCSADANLWFLASTDRAGTFDLSELPASQFSVEVISPQWRRPTGNPGRLQVWGFKPWKDTIVLQSGQSLRREIQLGSFGRQDQPMEAAPPCSPERPRVGFGADGLTSFLVEQTPAVYPRNQSGSNRQVRVNLEAFMNKEGKESHFAQTPCLLMATNHRPSADSGRCRGRP
jgi:hypothetical protein